MRRKLFIIPMLLVAIAAIAETSLVIQSLTGDDPGSSTVDPVDPNQW